MAYTTGNQGWTLTDAIVRYPDMYPHTRPTSPRPVNGHLNPEWVEWLMGWPIGWTACEPLATDRFHEWQRQHSNVYASEVDGE